MKHIYDLFGKYLTKFTIVDLDKKFCSLLKEDSIVFDDKAKEMISDEISKQIKNIINEYEYVFVKVNNKAGTDAAFLVTQLKCFTIEEIITLIKGSQRIMDNFDYEKDKNNFLVLKEWYKIEHKNEFRCFIVNSELKGISQRYIDAYENYDDKDIESIKNIIISFVSNDIKNALDEYKKDMKEDVNIILDVVYLPKKGKVKIIDIEQDIKEEKKNEEEEEKENILKLYKDWDEIKKSKIIELRYIKSENDPNIVQQEENKNRFPLELYETDIQTLIYKLNTKTDL